MNRLMTFPAFPNQTFGSVISIDRNDTASPAPGTFVKLAGQGGFGLVVGRKDKDVVVLWSQAPNLGLTDPLYA